ncbi:MAG: tRNA threonylcarbamoyladenosine dehydratase [Clostridia bacterium]|nr:tRNA threonylcarbamoyladenosine dehydratase [Clostridia bacterium]
MSNQFSRTQLLYGDEAVEKFKNSHVAVFGIGGVGGHCVEALVRSSVGKIDIIDNDTVSLTNINRQIIATLDTVGKQKVDVMEERIKSINPTCKVNKYPVFLLPENIDEFDFSQYDYVVDAIDTVSGKLAIVKKAYELNIPVISSMGAGNKLDPTAFEIADINKTSVCPLARVMRRLCRENGIKKLKVVYSKEEAVTPHSIKDNDEVTAKRVIPGSNAVVPAVAGLIIASEVLKDLSI